VQGLSFVDDVAWWADGKTEKETAEALGKAVATALEWAGRNGVNFDHAKTEAARESDGTSDHGQLPDDKSGGGHGRVGIAPGRECVEQQKSTPCAETNVVAKGKPSQVPPGR